MSDYFCNVCFTAPMTERRKFLYFCREYRRTLKHSMKFEEFLKCAVSLMEKGEYNRHWEPVFMRCDICHHNYTTPS